MDNEKLNEIYRRITEINKIKKKYKIYKNSLLYKEIKDYFTSTISDLKVDIVELKDRVSIINKKIIDIEFKLVCDDNFIEETQKLIEILLSLNKNYAKL